MSYVEEEEGAGMLETEVVELFVHGSRSSRPDDGGATPMLAMPEVEAVAGKGLRQDRRFFHAGDPGRERPRQVSLIDEGTIWRLERRFGPIDRASIKSQIVLAGELHLPDLLGATLTFDDGAELVLSIPRRPCFAMDYIAPGMKEAMEHGEQGALAMVTTTGLIRKGQAVQVMVPDRAAVGPHPG